MPKKKGPTGSQNGNEYGLRDFSHLPRAKDFPKPKNLTPEQEALRKAFREWMDAMAKEQEKYGTTLT